MLGQRYAPVTTQSDTSARLEEAGHKEPKMESFPLIHGRLYYTRILPKASMHATSAAVDEQNFLNIVSNTD